MIKRRGIKDFIISEAVEATDKLIDTTLPYREMIMNYTCALKEVSTKFEVLNEELSIKYNRNPVETIKTRIKTPKSILKKLEKKGLTPTIENIKNNIYDVAGVRIICSFIDDIYSLLDMFLRQDDITPVEIKDYIENPKESGYRSLHVIVEVPIFLSDKTKLVKVEVQFRTIAMDFWASLEHKLRYKQNISDNEDIQNELLECGKQIALLDERMQSLRDKIEGEKILIKR